MRIAVADAGRWLAGAGVQERSGNPAASSMLARIESAGGKVVQQKAPIAGAGFFGSFDDPSGNRVGVFSER